MVSLKRLLSVVFLGVILFGAPFAFAAQPRVMPMGTASASSSSVTGEQALVGVLPSATSGATSGDYVLGTGDKIKLTVYGETDLSGEYEVSSTGVVSLPLIGTIPVARHTLHDFEQAVTNKLSEGYLKDPRVSAQVINYRPFFILGEVSKPGSYPYVNGMTIINAVALAGGYTYRADKKDITITRANDPDKKDVHTTEEEQVLPGDVIRVPERFF